MDADPSKVGFRSVVVMGFEVEGTATTTTDDGDDERRSKVRDRRRRVP